jgi:hypothetical protein
MYFTRPTNHGGWSCSLQVLRSLVLYMVAVIDKVLKQAGITHNGHGEKYSLAAERRMILRRTMDRLSPMAPLDRLEWLLATEISMKALPQSLFQVEEICSAYAGQPSIELIRKKLQPYRGHWKQLLLALEASANEF